MKMEKEEIDVGSGKRTIQVEADCNWLKELAEELSNHKGVKLGNLSELNYRLIIKNGETEAKYLKLRDKFESGEREWSNKVNEVEEKCRCLEIDKSKVEMAPRSHHEAVEKLKAAEVEIEALKSLLGTKDAKITHLVKQNERLGREKMKIKDELQDWVLQMEQAVNKFTGATSASHVTKQAKGNQNLRSSANEDRKKRLEEDEKMKVEELLQRIGVLEKEKGEMEAEVWKLEREISLEKEKVLNNMAAMEAKEKKITELVQRIEVLEKENREIEANHANRQKSEIERILKEKMDVEAGKRAVKIEGEKEISQLVRRIGTFEKEKLDLEEEIRQKDEVIQVLGQEIESLEDKIKKLKLEISKRAVKSEEHADLQQQLCHAKNCRILVTQAQNQGCAWAGQNSSAFHHSDEHNGSVNHVVKIEGEMNVADVGNSKRSFPENLTGGSRSSEDTVSLGRFGNSSTAKRSRPSM